MNLTILKDEIVRHLTPLLLRGKYDPNAHHLAGHSYLATEALWRIYGQQEGWTVAVLSSYDWNVIRKGEYHWFLRRDSHILDLTKDQFPTYRGIIPYHLCHTSIPFTTGMSNKCRQLLQQMNRDVIKQFNPDILPEITEEQKPVHMSNTHYVFTTSQFGEMRAIAFSTAGEKASFIKEKAEEWGATIPAIRYRIRKIKEQALPPKKVIEEHRPKRKYEKRQKPQSPATKRRTEVEMTIVGVKMRNGKLVLELES